MIGVNNQRLWERFCDAVEAPELKADPLFADGRLRVLNRDALADPHRGDLRRRDTETWVQRLKAKGVPSGPINTIDQALADPQVAARGLLAQVGDRRFVRAPIGLSKTPVSVRRGPPELGARQPRDPAASRHDAGRDRRPGGRWGLGRSEGAGG